MKGFEMKTSKTLRNQKLPDPSYLSREIKNILTLLGGKTERRSS